MITLWAGHLVASLNIFVIAQYIYQENKYIFVRVNSKNCLLQGKKVVGGYNNSNVSFESRHEKNNLSLKLWLRKKITCERLEAIFFTRN